MINTLYLSMIIVGVTVQNITRKAYNQRTKNGVYTFSAFSALTALLIFLLPSINSFSLNLTTVLYSLLFATFYTVSTVSLTLSIKHGPLSITSLATAYSLIIPTLYGLIVFKENFSLFLFVGLVFLIISLLLVNLEKKGEEKKITLKWAIFTLLAFIGNGGCSTVQKIQQVNQKGNYKNEFMIIALTVTIFVLLIFAFIYEKSDIKANIKKGFKLYSICGLSNGIVNLLVIILALRMPSSVMFPLISAGGIIATFLISLLVYKEKLSIPQLIGMCFGVVSIIFLNI